MILRYRELQGIDIDDNPLFLGIPLLVVVIVAFRVSRQLRSFISCCTYSLFCFIITDVWHWKSIKYLEILKLKSFTKSDVFISICSQQVQMDIAVLLQVAIRNFKFNWGL